MSTRGRLLLATACGLVLAGIVHIVTVLAIPRFAGGAAFVRARSSDSLDHPLLIHALAPDAAGREANKDGGKDDAKAPPAKDWLPNPDPAVSVGVCAFDLDDGPMRVSARTGALNLSIAVHGRRGAFYAVTDQAAVRGALELVIMTRGQYDEALASENENEVNRDVRVVAPEREGYAVVRVIAALPSQKALADAAVEAVACTIDAPAEPSDADGKPGG